LGVRPALGQQEPPSTGAAKTTAQVKARAVRELPPAGKTTNGEKSDDGKTPPDKKCPPNCPPKPTPSAKQLLLVYVGAIGLMFLLHVLDSVQGYRFSKQTRDKLVAAMGSSPTAEQFNAVAGMAPTGIQGTTRSIFTYGLLALLGAAVFYLLAFNNDDRASEYADKLLTVLAGALSSIIGFYFGSKATTEGVKSVASPRDDTAPKPAGKITRIDPPKPRAGEEVTIEGTGFGEAGTVQFVTASGAAISAAQTKVWSPTLIKVDVPQQGLPPGKIVVAVNPSQGARILATNVPFEVVP
jgi:IPT/TIG domain-containing protein